MSPLTWKRWGFGDVFSLLHKCIEMPVSQGAVEFRVNQIKFHSLSAKSWVGASQKTFFLHGLSCLLLCDQDEPRKQGPDLFE